tara:strand:+ start:384 stop:545 length:162 start_codon:yes stop_codon:yes gene_type:complete
MQSNIMGHISSHGPILTYVCPIGFIVWKNTKAFASIEPPQSSIARRKRELELT